jgi:hypothetical protein
MSKRKKGQRNPTVRLTPEQALAIVKAHRKAQEAKKNRPKPEFHLAASMTGRYAAPPEPKQPRFTSLEAQWIRDNGYND